MFDGFIRRELSAYLIMQTYSKKVISANIDINSWARKVSNRVMFSMMLCSGVHKDVPLSTLTGDMAVGMTFAVLRGLLKGLA